MLFGGAVPIIKMRSDGLTEVKFSSVVVTPPPPFQWCCFPSAPLREGAAWPPPFFGRAAFLPLLGVGLVPRKEKAQSAQGRSTTTQEEDGKEGSTTQEKRGGQAAPPTGSSTTRNRIAKESNSRKKCAKTKLDPWSIMPLFEWQRPMQVAMSGLLGNALFVW